MSTAEAPLDLLTIDEAIDYYLSLLAAEGGSLKTGNTYRRHLRLLDRFAKSRGAVMAANLTPILVRQFVVQLMKPSPERHANFKGGEAAARTSITAARGMSKRLSQDNVDIPDLSSLRMPRLPERVQPRVTADEFRALERAAVTLPVSEYTPRALSSFRAIRDLAMLYFLADTGVRASEFCYLDISDVDLAGGSVLIRRGKRKKERALSIVDTDPTEPDGGLTLRVLRLYLEKRSACARDGENALWLSAGLRQRLTPEALRRVLNRLCQHAGLDSNRPVHTFRRAHFTENYRSEPSALPVLVARMGWSSMESNMVDVYTRGATVDFARTEPRPSMAKRWRGSTPAPYAAPVEDHEALTRELLAALQSNPAAVRVLLQALRGVA